MRPSLEAGRWADLFAQYLGLSSGVSKVQPVTGGCIHRALRVETAEGSFFVKENAARQCALFETEARALRVLAQALALRVPEVIGTFTEGSHAYLVLEYIEMGPPPRKGMAALGEGLARLHGTCGESFGWTEDNYIGSTPQVNPPTAEWMPFFRDHRLQPMADRLAARGLRFRQWNRLMGKMDTFFAGLAVRPSLLHGDLWGGNIGFSRDGTPVIFDPASYHGHAETDLALTELFGGFSEGFYEAYFARCPPAEGYARRRELYNLYHILNHALLFGGGYGAQADRMIAELAG